MQYRVLGPLEVLDDTSHPVSIDGPRLRTLLCRLLLDPGHVVPADTLVGCLWGDEAPEAAGGTLQTYISRLRRIIEPGRGPGIAPVRLVTRGAGYMLAVGPDEVDAALHERRVAEAREALGAGHPDRAVSLLKEARSLWRGRPLQDVGDEPWAAAAVARLDQQRISMLEVLCDAWLENGDLGTAIAELEVLVQDHPLHERFWAQLVTALYRSGRQADALRALERCRVILREELGLEPGPELRALEQAVLEHDPILGVRPVATRPREVAGARGRFVGREREREILFEAVLAAHAGEGRLIVIEGEAGIGKSRLAEITAEFARGQGLRVAWVACVDEIGAPPLWPWIQLSRELAVPGPVDGRADVDATADPDVVRFRELSSMVDRLLAGARSHGGVVAVVDDVQWADQASLQLLRLLVGAVATAPILVVLTVRRPELGAHPAVDAALADLLRSKSSQRLRLVGLSGTETIELVESISGRRDVHLTELLQTRTEGNPFFLSELAQLVALDGSPGAPPLDAVARGVPDNVREVVGRRVGRLSDDTQTMVRLAAVAASAIELPVLEQVTGLDAERVLELLEPAVDAGLLVELEPGDIWRFGHALAQDAVRSSLSRGTVARLHAAIADAIELVYRDELDDHLDALAHHNLEAVGVGRAAAARHWSERAAQAAHDARGYDRAAFHWEHALELLGSTGRDPIERYELLVCLAADLRLSGDLMGARARLEEAMRLARELGDDDRASRAALVFGGATLWYWRPYDEVDWGMVEEVRRLAEVAHGARRAELLGTLGVELYYSDRRAEGAIAAREAVEIARSLGDVPLLGRTLNNLVLTLWEPVVDDARLPAIEEALTYVGRGLPLQTEIIARVHRAAVNLRLGAIGAFEADLALCRGLAAELAVPELRSQLLYASGGLAQLRGDWAEAERLADDAFAIQSRTSLWGAEWAKVVQMGNILGPQGRIAELADWGLPIAEGAHMEATRPTVAWAVAEAGDRPGARRLAERWWEPNRRPDWTTDHVRADWGRLAASIGFPDPRAVYDWIVPFADRVVVAGTAVGCRGSTELVLGQLARAFGDTARARAHLDAAEMANAALGSRWLVDVARAERDALDD